MNNNKIQKIFHYIIVLLLVILWSIMMFFPEHIDRDYEEKSVNMILL